MGKRFRLKLQELSREVEDWKDGKWSQWLERRESFDVRVEFSCLLLHIVPEGCEGSLLIEGDEVWEEGVPMFLHHLSGKVGVGQGELLKFFADDVVEKGEGSCIAIAAILPAVGSITEEDLEIVQQLLQVLAVDYQARLVGEVLEVELASDAVAQDLPLQSPKTKDDRVAGGRGEVLGCPVCHELGVGEGEVTHEINKGWD